MIEFDHQLDGYFATFQGSNISPSKFRRFWVYDFPTVPRRVIVLCRMRTSRLENIGLIYDIHRVSKQKSRNVLKSKGITPSWANAICLAFGACQQVMKETQEDQQLMEMKVPWLDFVRMNRMKPRHFLNKSSPRKGWGCRHNWCNSGWIGDSQQVGWCGPLTN